VGQRLGQHFLIKGSILERIAAAACPAPERLVIEIGPGHGALTEKLLKRAERVIAIELDYTLIEHLRARFPERLEVIHADVLSTDLTRWPGAPIVGNLPYYITSPILEKALRLDVPRAVFLMQKEVAHRLVAVPGTRDYGFLTVQTAIFATARLLFEVQPSAFRPPPKVDSAVVLLEPHRCPVSEPEDFLRFAAAAFHQKRKNLRNNLAALYGKESIDPLPEASLRAEQLSLPQLIALYEIVRLARA
jgi:16S rRNA (adenine1518-N6/adenine1519-N6)-dimethyltransferase